MAMRTFQFWPVFAVVCILSPVKAFLNTRSSQSATDDSPSAPSPPSLAAFNHTIIEHVSLQFLEEPESVYLRPNEVTVLRCSANSTQGNVTIVWLYEGKPIPDNDPRWYIDDEELHVTEFKPEEFKDKKNKSNITGEYACWAKNDAGTLLSKTATIKIAELDKNVTVFSENREIYESQAALLKCSSQSVPPAEIEWEFNKLPLIKDKRYVPLPNGVLVIRNSKRTDSGIYRCRATNTILNETQYSSNSIKISHLEFPRIDVPLHFLSLNLSTNKSVLYGESVEFFCLTSGWPLPTIQWRDDKNVTIGSLASLKLKDVNYNHTGTYTCLASNSNTQIQQEYYLNVYHAPSFNLTPTSRRSPTASTIRLECHAKGTPQPVIYWLKNGKKFNLEGRIIKQNNGLVFTHTFTADAGLYQCVAENDVGRISTSAQIEINNTEIPNPPQNVACRPYSNNKICVTWKTPPNVSAQAYSVYSFYTNNGAEVSGPEYLSTNTFLLADGLKPSTNYTFYVRIYTTKASEHSETVVCQTDIKESRNLDIRAINSTSVALNWRSLNSDILCNGTRYPYIVEWLLEGDETRKFESRKTMATNAFISGLLPSTDYQFRIRMENYQHDEPWTFFSLPDSEIIINGSIIPMKDLQPPKKFHLLAVTSSSVKISWDRVRNVNYYSVCYVPEIEARDCTENDFIRSNSPKIYVTNLKPFSRYIFQVRGYSLDNVPGLLSKPFIIQTAEALPSAIENLEYKSFNSTCACICWRPPLQKNGNLTNYKLSYTAERNWSLENRVEYDIPVFQNQSCLDKSDYEFSDTLSFLLTNLSEQNTYLVMVRAANGAGIGPPLVITLNFQDKETNLLNCPKDVSRNQTIGIVIGVVLAIICIIVLIILILLRRRCLKRRADVHSRLNYVEGSARYNNRCGSIQGRMEDQGVTNQHETEHLISALQAQRIPVVIAEDLDDKDEANNSETEDPNDTTKLPHSNGTVLTDHMHITENPQYSVNECNGNANKNKSEPLLRYYEEDSNSNVKPVTCLEWSNCLDRSKKLNEINLDPYRTRYCHAYPLPSTGDVSLNSTQLSFLDNTFTSQRRFSPVIEPNG